MPQVNVAQLCKALDVTDAEATKVWLVALEAVMIGPRLCLDTLCLLLMRFVVQLVQTGIDLVQQVLFSSASISSLQDIAPFLPTTLHRRLAKLIAEVTC